MIPLDAVLRLIDTPHNRRLVRGWPDDDGVCPVHHHLPVEDCDCTERNCPYYDSTEEE